MAPLVDVVSEKEFESLGEKIKEALLKALQFLKEDDVSVEVSLVDNREMGEINEKTKRADHVPSVLSFTEPGELPQIEGEPRRIGEIYLAPEVVRDKGMDPVHTALHGLLHLLGYTHAERSDTIEMENLEDEIMDHIS